MELRSFSSCSDSGHYLFEEARELDYKNNITTKRTSRKKSVLLNDLAFFPLKESNYKSDNLSVY